MPNQSINKLDHQYITIVKVQDVEKANTRFETLGPLYDEYSWALYDLYLLILY